MRGALKWQGLFSCNRKNIYENRLTFVKFCGILELPLGNLLSLPLVYTSKSRRSNADYEERKSLACRKHIRKASVVEVHSSSPVSPLSAYLKG